MSSSLEPPREFAADRSWAVRPALDLDRFASLTAAWNRSKETIHRIRDALSRRGVSNDVVTVAVSGSLGRMEATPHSDCDLIVLLRDRCAADSDRARAAFGSVWDALEGLHLGRPKSEGVFADGVTLSQLLDPTTLGMVDEPIPVFGKRMQLLLDSQPLWRRAEFDRVIDAVLQRYGAGDAGRDPDKEWVYLLNDLIRYFRSLCVRTQWSPGDAGAWRTLNLKLQFSRLLVYAGLLALLGECSKERRDKAGWLSNHLRLTPLERLAWTCAANSDPGAVRVAEAYETFLASLADPDTRARLVATTERSRHWSDNAAYAALNETAAAMRKELTRFFLARRADWSDAFFEYLLA